jgi:signal transduction histidine kinase
MAGPAPWGVALLYLGVCGGIWLMGYTIRTRRIYVATLEERAATLEREREHLARIAVADERAAIARELHDVVAHSLAVMIVQADGGRYAFDSDPAQAREALTTVADTGREALDDMRRLVGVLRGTGTGPEPDRQWVTVEQLDTLVERARSAGLTVVVEADGVPPPLAPAVELAVHRIVQEALTNVLRHAGRHAKVTLSMAYGPEELALSILDDGGDRLGLPGEAAPLEVTAREVTARRAAGPGNGLVGMRERVAVHGGRFRAGPRLDGGWSVEVTIPVREPAAREAAT